MAKTEDATTIEAPAVSGVLIPAQQAEFPLSLEEFCTRLSLDDKRVELIGAFNHAEKGAGHNKDTESAYKARFSAFINQPA